MQVTHDPTVPQKGFVPLRGYTCLIKEVDNSPSAQKGTVMTKMTMQIVAPEHVTAGGEVFATAGQEFDLKFFFTEKSAARAIREIAAFGIPAAVKFVESGSADTEEVQAQLKALEGYYVDITVQNQQRLRRVPLTPAELAAGKDPYSQPIYKDAETGKTVVDGWEFNVRGSDVRAGTLKKPDGSNPF